MPKTLEEGDWNVLLRRIKAGKCTPFLGAGVNLGALPLGSEIAQTWADENHFPLKESVSDLPRVAQFLAITRPDPMDPKEEILERWFKHANPPDFRLPDEPLRILAGLPVPVYMTTNYDDFMIKALQSCGKNPSRELCRWNNHPNVKKRVCIWDGNPGFRPTPGNPVVFHLHGLDEVHESLVLTEDDYMDFLVNISRQQEMLPPRIQEALTGASLLFIGYKLADLTFRVIFRGLVNSMEPGLRRISVAVQLPPEEPAAETQDYLNRYFGNINVRVYWGTAKEFTTELKQRWSKLGEAI